MNSRVSKAIAAGLVVILSGATATASELTPQQQAVLANLVAQEFAQTCVATEGDPDLIATIAERRGWNPYPTALLGGMPIGRAWEGRVSSISISGDAAVSGVSFVAGVRRDEQFGECFFKFQSLVFESLVLAIRNQGFDEEDRVEVPQAGWWAAGFCRESNPPSAHSYEVVARNAVDPARPNRSGSMYQYRWDNREGRSAGCPILIVLDDRFVNRPSEPEIEPWLGQKPEEPPSHEEITE